MTYTTAPVLKTERLRLRPYRATDFEHFADLYASSRSRYADGPVSRATAWAWFAAGAGRWSIVGYGAWAIERLADRACVGVVSLNHPVSDDLERELGWLLWESFEGNGYAIEAAFEAKRFAFETLNWPTLVSYVSSENYASMRLAERMGAVIDHNTSLPDDELTLVFRHPGHGANWSGP